MVGAHNAWFCDAFLKVQWLRSALSTDEALLLHWANDPQVRAVAFRPKPYWLMTTIAGFRRSFGSKPTDVVATTADDCPIGQIRFDRQPVSADGVSFKPSCICRLTALLVARG